jgi:hypothetical protein
MDFGCVVQRPTAQHDGRSVNGEREVERSPVVGDVELGYPGCARVNIETQRIPGAFCCILKLRTHRDDGAGTYEEWERF